MHIMDHMNIAFVVVCVFSLGLISTSAKTNIRKAAPKLLDEVRILIKHVRGTM